MSVMTYSSNNDHGHELSGNGLSYHACDIATRLTRNVKDVDALAECARTLIIAYSCDYQDVDWDDINQALEHALKGFGLPSEYIERINAKQYEGN